MGEKLVRWREHEECSKNTKYVKEYNMFWNKPSKSTGKRPDGWIQTSSKWIVRRCTAEQLLSHILPLLAFEYVTFKVVPDN